MPTTPIYGWPVMAAEDPSDAPNQIMDLATAIESTVNQRPYLRRGGVGIEQQIPVDQVGGFPTTELIDAEGEWYPAGGAVYHSGQWQVPVDGLYVVSAQCAVYRPSGQQPTGTCWIRVMGNQTLGDVASGDVLRQRTVDWEEGPKIIPTINVLVYMTTGQVYGLSMVNTANMFIRFGAGTSQDNFDVYHFSGTGAPLDNYPPPTGPNPIDDAFTPVPLSQVDQTGLDDPPDTPPPSPFPAGTETTEGTPETYVDQFGNVYTRKEPTE